MNDNLFDELLSSVREGGRILRGESSAARVSQVADIDVRAVREEYDMPRTKFAAMLGISERTLEGWEQGRRKPQGPARTLLQVAARHPEAVLDTVQSAVEASQPLQPRQKLDD